MRSRQGSPVRRCVKASVNRVASSTSSRMSVIRECPERLADRGRLVPRAEGTDTIRVLIHAKGVAS